jgi:hypothetical protein
MARQCWNRCTAGRILRPVMMNRSEPHPVELLLLAGLVVIEALAVVVAAVLALVLTLASRRPSAPPRPAPLPPPAVHPLAVVAETLQALPQRELMALAGTRRKLPKHQLAALLVAACG